jgi:peroxiredoxin
MIIYTGCAQSPGPRIGEPFPSITLADVDGKTMNLPADFRGKVALIRFWSVTCPSCCKELLKTIDEMYRKYKDRGFLAVTINVDPSATAAEELRKLKVVSYPFLVDPGWKVTREIGIQSVPVTFIVDTRGVIREKISGDAPPEFFEQIMTQVLYKGGFYDLPMQIR